MKPEDELQPIPQAIDWDNAKIDGQAKAQTVTNVLLNDGNWYEVKPGSFKLFKTFKNENKKETGIPFVRFIGRLEGSDVEQDMVFELFPATVAGWAYPAEDSNE